MINLPQEKQINYPKNIKVISQDLFEDFIGLNDKNREEFDNILTLGSARKLKVLQRLHQTNSIKWNFKEDLKENLKQKNLISKNIHEYFKIPNRNEKAQKQLSDF